MNESKIEKIRKSYNDNSYPDSDCPICGYYRLYIFYNSSGEKKIKCFNCGWEFP